MPSRKNSAATAPRSAAPSTRVSRVSSTSSAAGPGRRGSATASFGRNSTSNGSSTVFSRGSRVTTQVWSDRGGHPPRGPQPFAMARHGRPRHAAATRSAPRRRRASLARTSSSASRSRCSPVSGTFSRWTGTCHPSGLFIRSGSEVIFGIISSRHHRPKWREAREKQASRAEIARHPPRPVARPRGGHRRRARATPPAAPPPNTLRASACFKGRRIVRGERALIAPGAAVEGFHHALHLLWARRGRRRPSRADCGPCRGRRHRAERARAPHPWGSRASRRSTTARCSTIISKRPSTVSAMPNSS